jgi:hypothetical protein
MSLSRFLKTIPAAPATSAKPAGAVAWVPRRTRPVRFLAPAAGSTPASRSSSAFAADCLGGRRALATRRVATPRVPTA